MAASSPKSVTQTRTGVHVEPVPSDRPFTEQPNSPRRGRAKFVTLGMLALALLGGAGAYWLSLGKETTDDAQVEAHVLNISSRVSGVIAMTVVKDNQSVKLGDVLAELDRADFEARLAGTQADLRAAKATLDGSRAALALAQSNVDATLRQARGGLAQATSGLGVSRAELEQSQADEAAAAARLRLATTEFGRVRQLLAGGALSQASLDEAQARLDEATASMARVSARLNSERASIASGYGSIESANGRLAVAQAGPQQVDAAKAAVMLASARVEQAEAANHLAELNLSYTTIRAPRDGMVARRAAEVGQAVAPDRPLFAIVPLDDTWVVANFKEDQLTNVVPGARADIEVDAFGGKTFAARVESISAGTGSRFALLPPDNATGNFTKVVQRVPVLLRLLPQQGVALRPGFSAKVTVYSGGLR
jgi:membrane fusion protein (multidrug efflux system)